MSDVEEKSVACEVVTHSTEETIACGRTVGGLLEEGDVLVLTGDLGAGKTQFTKGIAAALGVVDDVCSPTFNIQMVYEGERMPLYHFDLYRLDGADERPRVRHDHEARRRGRAGAGAAPQGRVRGLWRPRSPSGAHARR